MLIKLHAAFIFMVKLMNKKVSELVSSKTIERNVSIGLDF